LDVFQWLWLFFIAASVWPAIQQRLRQLARYQVMASIQKRRNSRVIALVHRQETMALLGIPLFRYIDIEDSEQVLRAIKLTDDSVPIDLVLHTPGGLVLAANQVAHALGRHPSRVTVFVPHYAMSGGTLIALAADEIVMDENAVLGPVDPQLEGMPATSILRTVERKDVNELDDKTLVLADVGEKAIRQVHDTVRELIGERMSEKDAETLASELSGGQWTHDYPITTEEAEELGLPISTDVPEDVYKLMALYPQPTRRRPTVSYIPGPRPERDQD
jgi:ClpP class serine protease